MDLSPLADKVFLTMNLKSAFTCVLCAVVVFAAVLGWAQSSTPPATAAELETVYNQVLDRRVDAILQRLALTNTSTADRVRNTLLLQYRTLRVRDEAMDASLKAQGKDPTELAARAELRVRLSKPLREWFVSVLALDLSPVQIESVKDAMTYDKVKFTFDAYCRILPNLTDAEKAMILVLLKLARDEAIDGGSAPEKSAIFQTYKDQINTYLDANGHNVAQANKDWEAKQAAKAQVATGK